MDLEEFIKEELIMPEGEAESAEEAIGLLGELLIRQGYIQSAYVGSVMEREKQFPTGMALEKTGIAIPHATPNGNVLKNGVAVLRLAQLVVFHSMESPEDMVETEIIFMLALKDSNGHLAMLQKLFGMFQAETTMEILRRTKDKRKFRETFIQYLK